MTTIEAQEHEYHIAERKSWGKKLLRAAWTIEIIAMFIGLMVAWSMGLQAYQAYTKDGAEFPIGKTFDLFLAALPFVMVAGVELLKIPFSYLIYINKNKKVKVIFSIVLVLVTFITFETLITGFERQYANITTEVDVPRNKLAIADNSINAHVTELKELELFTIESINEKIRGRREQVEKNKNEDLKVLEGSKKDYLASGNSNLIQRNQDLQKKIDRLEKQRDAEQEKIASINSKRIEALRKEKDDNRKEISKIVKRGETYIFSENPADTLRKRNKLIDKQIQSLYGENSTQKFDKKIQKIYDKKDENNKKMARNTQFKSEIANIENLKQTRRLKYSEELKEIDQFKDRELERLKSKGARIDDLNTQLLPLRKQKLALENEVIAAYSATQIYRIARTAYGVERGQRITEKQIALVATVWFGSLAGIVSTMGIFLAFGSFVLSHPVAEFHNGNKRGGNPLIRSFRLMFRALRKRFKEPKIVTKIKEIEVSKEVIKEVPVDKVVLQEIPVEIVRKEIIHVPIYTNDTDLIKFGTTKVKDIIKND
ncbi:MAG: hypothetical protein HAW58_05565 [Candidatus Thioglobus sp.]|nr:hypothetical protein [Candidatus Thioglobus sp.]